MTDPVHRAVPSLVMPRMGDAARECAPPAPPDPEVIIAVPPEAFEIALAGEHVMTAYRTHRAKIMSSADWDERDRVSFDALGRALRAFWSREQEPRS